MKEKISDRELCKMLGELSILWFSVIKILVQTGIGEDKIIELTRDMVKQAEITKEVKE